MFSLRTEKMLIFLLLAGMLLSASKVLADLPEALLNMENGDNPLVRISTDRGDVFVELFPRAAPRNVEHFLALAQGEIAVTDTASTEAQRAYNYDGLPFHRIISNHFIQAGNHLTPADTLPHEINARRLGLHEQSLIDGQGAPHPWLNISDSTDFQQTILLPLYRNMRISSESTLEQRQNEVLQRLRQLNLQQAYELMGYLYDDDLPSRMPLAGSMMMVARGPEGNSPEFFITLIDAPWLMGKNTVIGQVVSGLETVRVINRAGAGNTHIDQVRQVNQQPSPSP